MNTTITRTTTLSTYTCISSICKIANSHHHHKLVMVLDSEENNNMNYTNKTSTIPHVLMVSFPGQGHINPLLRFAKVIASKGVLVTFSCTADYGQKIADSTNRSIHDLSLDRPVGRGFLRFEFFPDNGIVFDDPNILDQSMGQLREVGIPALAELISQQTDTGRPVSCLVNNPFIPWVLDVAENLNIPSGCLWVQSCAVFSIYYHYRHSLAEFPSETNPNVAVSLPGLPTLQSNEIPSFLLPSNRYKSLKDAILDQFSNISKASWVFVNSFTELEKDAVEAISTHVPIIPVGPLVEPEDESSSSISGDIFKAADCLKWLDAHAPRSVVYVSLGSIVVLSKEEMFEMAYGLLNSEQPFLWVVRRDCQQLLPDGYADLIEDKGLVVNWSPQYAILKHKALACFLTHCGWNSTLEALTTGVSLITYAQWGDQVTDEKFLVDVYGVGVKLPAPVKREELRRCVEAVTRGNETNGIRERAEEWSKKAAAAVAVGGSSEKNIQAFVDEIRCRTYQP